VVEYSIACQRNGASHFYDSLCVEGVSRPPSTVLAYLMSEQRISYKQALRVVKLRLRASSNYGI
jgi:hypothetical protein